MHLPLSGRAAGTAAISAARLGLKVALIQDRPVLGGNNSSEERVHLGGRIKVEPYPSLGDVVKEIGPSRGGNAQPADFYEDEKKMQMVLDEFGEPTAPETPDKMTMGASVQWYSAEENQPVGFPVFQYGAEFSEESAEQVTMGE